MIDQVSVAGSHISAYSTAPAGLSNPGRLLPPVTSTFPSGRSVVLSCRRPIDIGATERQEGVAAFRSITSAEALGRIVGVALGSGSRGFPPTMSTLPSAYIAHQPQSREG